MKKYLVLLTGSLFATASLSSISSPDILQSGSRSQTHVQSMPPSSGNTYQGTPMNSSTQGYQSTYPQSGYQYQGTPSYQSGYQGNYQGYQYPASTGYQTGPNQYPGGTGYPDSYPPGSTPLR